MQLSDSRLHPSLLSAPDHLQQQLQDIVNRVEIQPGFCIRHPDYKPLELPPEALARFSHLPSDLQHKYLQQQLRGFLYGIYYNGSLQAVLSLTEDNDAQSLSHNLENNTFLGVDIGFYERLHNSNCGAGYFDPGWLVLAQVEQKLVVSKGGLRLHVEPDRHLPADTNPTVGDTVAIRLPRNLVQNGFYMAVGNAGPQEQGQMTRVYCNLTPAGALAVMDGFTRQLNEMGLCFSFKTLYNPTDYGRFDAAVLYFAKSDYLAVQPVLQAVYDEHQSHFQPQVPLFTKTLAPGLAIAEEPEQTFSDHESFGTHRCQIVANGLLAAQQQGDESPEARLSAIHEQFSLLGLEWRSPHLNPNSEDVYTPLEL